MSITNEIKRYINRKTCCVIRQYNTLSDFPNIGSKGSLYIDKSTDSIYYWNGSVYELVLSTDFLDDRYYTQSEVEALLADKVDLDALETTLTLYGTTTTEVIGNETYFQLVTNVEDARYNDTEQIITSPAISSTDSNNPDIIGRLIADAGVVSEIIQDRTINTIGQVRKSIGNNNENPRLRFTVYNSNDLTPANFIARSGYTDLVESEDFFNIFENETVLSTVSFGATDRIVIIWEAYTTQGSPNVEIKFGGNAPVRTVIPKTFDATFNSENVIYDNTVSGLVSQNVKDAVDELDSNYETIQTNLDNHINQTGNVHGATPSDIGAAPVSHTHIPTDITGLINGVSNKIETDLIPTPDITNLFSAGVIDNNNAINLKFWAGTQAEYDVLTPSSTIIYFII